MLTLQHPHAPTVSYSCELPKALASYACDHLDGYGVFVVESDTHGITLEVFGKDRKDHLGYVEIH